MFSYKYICNSCTHVVLHVKCTSIKCTLLCKSDEILEWKCRYVIDIHFQDFNYFRLICNFGRNSSSYILVSRQIKLDPPFRSLKKSSVKLIYKETMSPWILIYRDMCNLLKQNQNFYVKSRYFFRNRKCLYFFKISNIC